MNIVERLAEKIIKDAVRSQATDIHIIPRKQDTLIQLRLGSKLIPRYCLPVKDCIRLVSHFKFTAAMDIGEKRRPQSGACTYQIGKQHIGLRFSTLPSINRESLVIRIIPQYNQIPFNRLSLFPNSARKMLSLIKQAHGLIILTGPTGSGKTSTLYALMKEISQTSQRNVVTLEDPIEKENDYSLQVQVNEKAGISYAAGLKAILRHDPDIIMVGEVRDAETAQITVRAALTGHLVLTTMHTRDAEGAIYRLAEFGVNPLEIQQTLIAVTAQRLVELCCPFCGKSCSPYCYSDGRWKRASVFEFLAGNELHAAIQGLSGEKQDVKYRRLKDSIRKGIALGFIKESEYDRWVLENEED